LKEISDMAGEILVSGEARGGSISAAIVTDEQRSLKPKDPCPFRKLILWAADGAFKGNLLGFVYRV